MLTPVLCGNNAGDWQLKKGALLDMPSARTSSIVGYNLNSNLKSQYEL